MLGSELTKSLYFFRKGSVILIGAKHTGEEPHLFTYALEFERNRSSLHIRVHCVLNTLILDAV